MTLEGFTSTVSQHTFTTTMDRLERACVRHGMSVFARIDHALAAAVAGLSMRPTQVLIVGNARSGTPHMTPFPKVAIDLPLRILAWEDSEGRVNVGFNDPQRIAGQHAAGPEVASLVTAMRAGLSEVVADASGGTK